MKIFTDANMVNEIHNKELDLGIVSAGEVKEFSFWALNETDANLKNMRFSTDHAEVEILKFPVELPPHTNGKLVLKWSPSITLKQGLRTTLRIQAQELWG